MSEKTEKLNNTKSQTVTKNVRLNEHVGEVSVFPLQFPSICSNFNLLFSNILQNPVVKSIIDNLVYSLSILFCAASISLIISRIICCLFGGNICHLVPTEAPFGVSVCALNKSTREFTTAC